MSDILEVFEEPSSEVVEEVETVETQAEEAPEPEQTAEPDVEEKPEETTSKEEETEKDSWTFTAVKDERGKRQKAEARAEQAEAKLKELESQLNKPEEKTPDIFDDQEGYTNAILSRVDKALADQKLSLSIELMRDLHSDFDDVTNAFMEAAKDNPILTSEAQKAANPAKYAYEQGKKYMQFQEMQDTSSYEAKLRAEIEKKVRAEVEAEQKESESLGSNLSPSLAKARGSLEQNEKVSENPIDLFG